MNEITIKGLEKIEKEEFKENIEKFGKKEYYKKMLEIYKPLLDATKKQKQKLKKKGTYDLITVTDRFTGEETKIHIGMNCMDKAMKKGKRYLLKKILYGRIMGDKK